MLAGALAAGAVACILPPPSYEGTSFSCAEPPHLCPDGFECVEERCVLQDGTHGGGPDAGPGAQSAPGPDAGAAVRAAVTYGR